MGSSPLTRGIQSGWSTNASVSRFTPAHAGNTSGQKSALCSMKVHPRSRGEYMGRNKAAYYLLGSPPLTRGILASAAISVTPVGFTPAHAGNTSVTLARPPGSGVHPRSRGEYGNPWRTLFRRVGSPPLTRGIRPKVRCTCTNNGFTPAHAGNTTHAIHAYSVPEVHPRSRGEY